MSQIFKAAICVFLGLVLASSVNAKSSSSSNSLQYKITDLGKISNGELIVDIFLNNNGFICGNTGTEEFVIKDGIIQPLEPSRELRKCHIMGLNDKNQILEVGYNADNRHRSYVREADNTIHNLNGPEFDDVTAGGINSNGEIVGWFGFYERPFFYKDGTFTELPQLFSSQFTTSFLINDRQQIAGWTQSTDFLRHGFITNLNGEVTDLNELVGQECAAGGLNNQGDVLVGTKEGLFLSTAGKFQKLGVSLVTASIGPVAVLNDLGDVVGSCAEEFDGFIYHDGQLSDIRELIPDLQQFKLILPHSINNSREIVAIGTVDDDWANDHIVLLTPIEE